MADHPVPARDLAGRVRIAAEVLEPLGERVVPNGPLGLLSTYRVGGNAALLVTVATIGELDLVAEALACSRLPVLVVGRGSNLLVSDAGFQGVAVVLNPTSFSMTDREGTKIRAGAALPLPALARQTVEAGLSGLEWGVGVPGSVGGAVRMNAGGHGSEVAHHLVSCTVVDLFENSGPVEVDKPALQFAYRSSAITPGRVVVEATFELAPGDPEEGRSAIREIVRWRREHQPGGQNAGSVFTNPKGVSAGWLIEAAGLKGRRWGSAQVSDKHANFIQADPGGSADDVRALIDMVREEVRRSHGVELVPEVRMVGFEEVSTSSKGLE